MTVGGGDPQWQRALPSSEVGGNLVPAEVEETAENGGSDRSDSEHAGSETTRRTTILLGRLIGGEVVAVSRICPHRGRPMDGGALYTDEIVCPNHHYTYDARTGENRYPKRIFPRHRAKRVQDISTYPAEDDGEWVWVRI